MGTESTSGASTAPDATRAFLVFPRFHALASGRSRVAEQARSAATLLRDGTRDPALRDPEQDDEGIAPGPPAVDGVDDTAEFGELARSAGATIVGTLRQTREKPDPATLLGSGKVDELAAAALAADAGIVLVDFDLSPTQLRNLEDSLPCPVADRTQLILDIFARHARTREGHLQVELAQLEYMLPRLAGRGRAMSQLGGGIGTRGPGETQLETDRRRIARRLVHLREELERVRRVRQQQRTRREAVPVPTVALVGYTNAGKSTLFNQLSGAAVLASSRLFATLDPKLKAIVLPSHRRILLSDTVGFIRSLPHTLVTSFRATLEEVQRAEVLLHVRDASDPRSEENRVEVEKVLGELDVLAKPRIEVFNKADLLTQEQRESLAADGHVAVSALQGTGMAALLAVLDRSLVADPMEESLLWIPQAEGEALAGIEYASTVLSRAFDERAGESGVLLHVVAPRSQLGRWQRFTVSPAAEKPRTRKPSSRA